MADVPSVQNRLRPVMRPRAEALAEIRNLGFTPCVVFDDAEPATFWSGRPPASFFLPQHRCAHVIVRGGLVTQVCYGSY